MTESNDRVTLEGRIRRDPALARLTEPVLAEELEAISSYLYRAAVSEYATPELSGLFESIALDEMEHFRLLERLILALGGNPAIRLNLRNAAIRMKDLRAYADRGEPTAMIRQSIREEEKGIGRYEEIVAHSDDPMVRSLLLGIVSEEREHIARLGKKWDEWWDAQQTGKKAGEGGSHADRVAFRVRPTDEKTVPVCSGGCREAIGSDGKDTLPPGSDGAERKNDRFFRNARRERAGKDPRRASPDRTDSRKPGKDGETDGNGSAL